MDGKMAFLSMFVGWRRVFETMDDNEWIELQLLFQSEQKV